MDSKVVNKSIKNMVWKYLKEQGFSKFTSRNAWRYRENTIEVVNFQSFNIYLAESIGCTTYSFAVNLGIYFIAIPNEFPNYSIKEKDGLLLPYDYDCQLRKNLIKRINQPEIDRRDIWYINETGDNIEITISDVRQELISDGLKWFEKYSRMDTVLDTLLYEEESIYGTHGFGRKDSPARNYIGAYIAYYLKRYDLASKMFEKTINSGCYKAVEERLKRDYMHIKDR